MKDSKTEKWFWKMDYCKAWRYPPAQTWAWEKAEKAYKIHVEWEKENEYKQK